MDQCHQEYKFVFVQSISVEVYLGQDLHVKKKLFYSNEITKPLHDPCSKEKSSIWCLVFTISYYLKYKGLYIRWLKKWNLYFSPPKKMQFEGLRCTSSNIWTLPLWERRVLTSNRMTCVHVFSTFKKRRRQSLMRNNKESSASSTINGWLSCSWRTMTSGVCFQQTTSHNSNADNDDLWRWQWWCWKTMNPGVCFQRTTSTWTMKTRDSGQEGTTYLYEGDITDIRYQEDLSILLRIPAQMNYGV